MIKATLLDIDLLKSTGRKPAWFGLGFFQLKLNITDRLHFYHPHKMKDLPAEELHNHRYDFTSSVLLGHITNSVYGWIPSETKTDHKMVNVDCMPGTELHEDFLVTSYGEPYEIASSTIKAGSYYKMKADTLHRVETSWAVTHLSRSRVLKPYAQAIRKEGEVEVCPFSNPMSEDDCWQAIDEVIKGFPSAYHASPIEKGVLGHPSKIIEEANELLDAHLQGNKVMADCEISDILGAIDSYLKETGSNNTVEDYISMMKANQRAFKTGKRS